MRLPGADRVRIDEQKIPGLLAFPNASGGPIQGEGLRSVGFRRKQRPGLRPRAPSNRGQWRGRTSGRHEFGRKYTVPGDLRGSAGSAQVLTVWIQEAGQTDVRLVTVRPRWP